MAEFLVRDESGRGGSVRLSAAELVERFGEDWDDATEGEHPFAECIDGLEVGGELRLDGATVVVRVA